MSEKLIDGIGNLPVAFLAGMQARKARTGAIEDLLDIRAADDTIQRFAEHQNNGPITGETTSYLFTRGWIYGRSQQHDPVSIQKCSTNQFLEVFTKLRGFDGMGLLVANGIIRAQHDDCGVGRKVWLGLERKRTREMAIPIFKNRSNPVTGRSSRTARVANRICRAEFLEKFREGKSLSRKHASP